MDAGAAEVIASDVIAALRTVRDPELDESIVELGFIAGAAVAGDRADIRLRLPTYFCAPNFAYLMVADARDAVLAVPGIERARVVLEDHFAAAEINAGVAAGTGFAESFPGQAEGELDELRLTFRRKAHLAAMERAARALIALGWKADDLPGATVGDLPAGESRDGLMRRRADIGLPATADSPLVVDDAGRPVPADQVPLRLRMGRLVGVNIEGNSHICRGLLGVRYPDATSQATVEVHT